MLANTVAEVQLDCMQRLVHSLCNAGRIQLLCALPFSANLLVRRISVAAWPPSSSLPPTRPGSLVWGSTATFMLSSACSDSSLYASWPTIRADPSPRCVLRMILLN
jgi:hypothetical protein